MTPDPRCAAAEAALHARGLTGACVTADGPEGEIAAVRVAEDQWMRLLEESQSATVAELRALGFRYVALDLMSLES